MSGISGTDTYLSCFPVLASYKQEVKTGVYTTKLQEMLTDLKQTYGYGDEDAFLVLKDILAQIYNAKKAYRRLQCISRDGCDRAAADECHGCILPTGL